MKAIVWTRYGPPEGLQLADVATPIPTDTELLIRIRATTVTAGDCELRGLRVSLPLQLGARMIFGLTRPHRKILGQELAGEVVAVGRRVTAFRTGDRVFGTTGFGFGAYAEFICLPERAPGRAIATMPPNLSFEEAATAPTGGLEALHFLRAAGALTGKRVLINGAAGGIGTFAIQIAKMGGADVTGVDGPTRQTLMRSIGADRVIDYTRQDALDSVEQFDVILDVVGALPFSRALARLCEGGSYLVANPRLSTRLRGLRGTRPGRTQVLSRPSRQATEDLFVLREHLEAGRLRTVIDRRFPLEQMVEAHRYFESGLALGKVVVAV